MSQDRAAADGSPSDIAMTPDADSYRHARPLVMLGIGAILAYNVTSAAKEVYAGHVLQTADPFVLITLCFGLVVVVFQILHRLERGGSRVQPGPVPAASVLRLFIVMNLTTTGAWLGLYFALRYLEPAVAGGLSGGVGPLAVLLWRRWTGRPIGGDELLSGLGILAACLLLAWSATAGQGLVIDATPAQTLAGLASATAGGISATLASVWAKKLSGAGMSPVGIMAHRFYVLVALAAVLALVLGRFALPLPDLGGVVIIGLFGVAAPLYALQVGIKYCRIFHVNIIIGLCPLFTLGFQAFSAWVHWSGLTVLGVVMLVVSGYVGLFRIRRPSRVAAAGVEP
ncbi:hypothetical protein P7L78_19795 [Tistrella bauzanensis]|jgi:drug/metabolite transporter (DMT)-like permease|uniref:EamA domain-containing protein n=1 Tax=Tistrella arctica TaxID=3133430 RepID=A0ABU9YPM9_9PROT